MRLIFKDPSRPKDQFVIHDRTDKKDPIVREGETFSVPDAVGRNLLSHYHPRIQEASKKKKDAPAGSLENPIATNVEGRVLGPEGAIKLERAQPETKQKRAAE